MSQAKEDFSEADYYENILAWITRNKKYGGFGEYDEAETAPSSQFKFWDLKAMKGGRVQTCEVKADRYASSSNEFSNISVELYSFAIKPKKEAHSKLVMEKPYGAGLDFSEVAESLGGRPGKSLYKQINKIDWDDYEYIRMEKSGLTASTADYYAFFSAKDGNYDLWICKTSELRNLVDKTEPKGVGWFGHPDEYLSSEEVVARNYFAPMMLKNYKPPTSTQANYNKGKAYNFLYPISNPTIKSWKQQPWIKALKQVKDYPSLKNNPSYKGKEDKYVIPNVIGLPKGGKNYQSACIIVPLSDINEEDIVKEHKITEEEKADMNKDKKEADVRAEAIPIIGEARGEKVIKAKPGRQQLVNEPSDEVPAKAGKEHRKIGSSAMEFEIDADLTYASHQKEKKGYMPGGGGRIMTAKARDINA